MPGHLFRNRGIGNIFPMEREMIVSHSSLPDVSLSRSIHNISGTSRQYVFVEIDITGECVDGDNRETLSYCGIQNLERNIIVTIPLMDSTGCLSLTRKP